MPRIRNSFTGGIDQDTATTKRKPDTYYSAENVRVLINEELASGAITNIKGTTNLNLPIWLLGACASKGIYGVSHSIIGAGEVRDTLVLFTVGTRTDGTTNSFIFGLEITKTGITSCTLYYSDSTTIDGSSLNFSTEYTIKGFASYYENPKNIKIYWSDFRADAIFSPLRSMNIAREDLMDGSVGISADSFNIIPTLVPTSPIIDSVTSGGDLKSGLIQYAYQLYNKYGTKSIVSPLSNLVHLTPTNYTTSNSLDFKGGVVEESSGKAVNLSINVADTTYNRIRIFAIHYTSETAVPTISVLQDSEVAPILKIKDSGNNYVDTLSLEEFVTIPDYFTAEDLAVKDNILFAANIKTKNFDFDFDARAYRFAQSSGTTKLYASDGTYISIGATPDPGATAHYTWNDIADIPEEYDAINIFNSATSSLTVETSYFYRRNSDRFGGSGRNVSYEFVLEDIVIDNSPHNDTIYTTGFQGYEDYNKVSFRDWQRDEVYRFGLVGFNDKMQPSPVKWIGDIRMPAYNQGDSEYDTYSAIKGGATNVTNSRLSIEFTVNIAAFIEEVKYYQIVYVKRELKDRTVLAEGVVGNVFIDNISDGSSFYKIYGEAPYVSQTSFAPYAVDVHDIFQFVSPDVLYSKEFNYTPEDYLRIDGYFEYPDTNFDTDLGGGSFSDTENLMTFIKYKEYHNISQSRVSSLENMYHVSQIPNITEGRTSIDIGKPRRFVNWVEVPGTGGAHHYGSSGSKAILTVPSTSPIVPISPFPTIIAYYAQYKRPRSAQYGGNYYEARKKNTYIACSPLYYKGTTGATAYGDTYVSMMDYIHCIWYENATEGEELFSTVYFPVASTHNCSIRTTPGVSPRRNDANYWLLSEEVGRVREVVLNIGGNDTTYTFTLETPLYAYNNTYSRVSDIFTYFPKPDDYEEIVSEDYLTKYSDVKLPRDYIDSWANFRTLNSNIVNGNYGAIRKLEVFNDKLIFIQEKAVGMWHVNTRELIATDNPGALSLGIGDVLKQFDYLDTESGTNHYYSVVNTGNGIYYFDGINKDFFRMTVESRMNITRITGLSTLIKSFNSISSLCVAGYNKEFNEIVMHINGSTILRDKSYTIVYNELGNKFYTFYSKHPKFIKEFNNILLSTDDLTNLYTHDSGDYGYFYDDLVDSNVNLLINPQSEQNTKAFMFTEHNLMLDCTKDGMPVEKGISSVQCSNGYQVSQVLDFESSPDLLIRRNRLYRFYLPRQNNDAESRLIDTHLFSKLTFKNEDNLLYTLHDVETVILPTNN